MLAGMPTAEVRALTVYNPVDDSLVPDGTPVDERKLVFFSSPNKGLDFALDAFAALKDHMPDLRLVVGNPGYRAAATPHWPGASGTRPGSRCRTRAATPAPATR